MSWPDKETFYIPRLLIDMDEDMKLVTVVVHDPDRKVNRYVTVSPLPDLPSPSHYWFDDLSQKTCTPPKEEIKGVVSVTLMGPFLSLEIADMVRSVSCNLDANIFCNTDGKLYIDCSKLSGENNGNPASSASWPPEFVKSDIKAQLKKVQDRIMAATGFYEHEQCDTPTIVDNKEKS